MPIYEYRCPSCGEIFEKLVRVASSDNINCPRCNSDKPQRMISLFAQSSSGAGAMSSADSSACATGT